MSEFMASQAEAEAVDAGVQDALPKDARWHRREARKLLVGKSGLTAEEKVERIDLAIELLEKARTMMVAAQTIDAEF